MALSDQLSKLAARAKELEDHAAAAEAKAKSDLEQDVKRARESAQAQGDKLRESASKTKGDVASKWDKMQRAWNDHLKAARDNLRSVGDAVDIKTAQLDTEPIEPSGQIDRWRRKGGAGAAVLSGFAMGLQEIFYPRPTGGAGSGGRGR